MNYTTQESDSAVVLNPAAPPAATVIWLHGLGADGYDFVPIVSELGLPGTTPVRFVFPHAAQRPVTINNGFVMRAWYDIKGLDRSGPEDEQGIRESEHIVRTYIEREIAAGISAERIALAGFSQGGAMALQTGLRHGERLAGVAVLSAYLPLASSLAAEASPANRDVPILMCHGQDDPIVPLALAEASRDMLRAQGYPVDWRVYPMAHQVCMPQIEHISAWLQDVLRL
ncbi:MAG: carboxylesterase [Proteobacteria bacterium]|nr:MAG: carboxylesterase [Pseudomonadota bacterium]